MPATLFVVATPIGNLEDITTRALRVLREATLIAAEDTRRTGHLLARYAIQTPTTSLHEHNETRKAASIIARLERGDSVALVSDAGTPTISDPGQRLVRAAIDAGIRVEPIPGANAAIATLAVSGFEAGVFAFLGFPPARGKDRRQWFERLKSAGPIVVFYEAPHRIRQTMEQLQAVVGDCAVVIGRELTKTHEELVRGPISEAIKRLAAPKGEFTVVVNLGQSIENEMAALAEHAPPDEQLLVELGRMTELAGFSRRAAISAIAKRHALSSKAVYAAIERAKKLAE